ncbi:MAG: sigma-70 family RNA polymerase sigma factor [Verrucomicrobia bacterium]|nr:sigma-70 family RNA polymerase sigma factor [Verrucomicrobiota bacterium]
MTPNQEPLSTLHTRPSLLGRLQRWDDAASWEEFHRLYRKLIYGLARHSGLSHAEAEDVTQEVLKRVAETIHEFESNPERGSFRGWLMQLTRWRIADTFRRRPKGEVHRQRQHDETGGRTSTIERVPDGADADTVWDEEWRRHLLDAACQRIARRVKPRHYQVFELYVCQQWPVLQVARELQINPAAVYLIGHRLTKQLKTEVAKLQAQLE